MKLDDLLWECDPPKNARVRIQEIDRFDARGMRRIYGRGDGWPKRPILNLDIWVDRHGRVFARFWSRGEEVDDMSFELHGIRQEVIPDISKGLTFSDEWIPKKFRKEYEDWIISSL